MNKLNYQYPIDETWSKREIFDVIHFFNLIEKAYESSVERDSLLAAYQRFKEIVPSKSQEKIYFADFQKDSTYSSYHAVKKARDTNEKTIVMKI